jgi:hypothetical protein
MTQLYNVCNRRSARVSGCKPWRRRSPYCSDDLINKLAVSYVMLKSFKLSKKSEAHDVVPKKLSGVRSCDMWYRANVAVEDMDTGGEVPGKMYLWGTNVRCMDVQIACKSQTRLGILSWTSQELQQGQCLLESLCNHASG